MINNAFSSSHTAYLIAGYGLSFLVMAILVIQSVRRLKRARKHLHSLEMAYETIRNRAESISALQNSMTAPDGP